MSKTKVNRAHKPARTQETTNPSGADAAVADLDTSASATSPTSSGTKAASKVSRVVALLRRQGGAGLDELVAETSWQPHTTRAALTGLRKKGHVVQSEKIDGVRRYCAAAVK